MSIYGSEFAPTALPGDYYGQREAVPSTVFFHELNLDLDEIRNPKIKTFITSHDFIPYYPSEITTANERLGLADALHHARFAGNNVNRPIESQVRAAERSYETVESYVKKSDRGLKKLRLAFKETEGLPSPQEIRTNPEIIETIADFILAFRKFEAGSWPAHNAGVLASALEQIKEKLALVSDEEAVALWDLTRLNLNERYKFWNSQLMEVKNNRIVREIMALRDSRNRTQPDSGDAQTQVVEYEGMAEQVTEPESQSEDGEPAGILPDSSMLIEGTQVEVVTNQPVEPQPQRKKAKRQKEKLFTTTETAPQQGGERRSRPVRGVLAGIADRQAARRQTETDISRQPLPEKPVGVEEARRMIERGELEVSDEPEVTSSEGLNGRAVDLKLRAQLREVSNQYGGNGSSTAIKPPELSDDDFRQLLKDPDSSQIAGKNN